MRPVRLDIEGLRSFRAPVMIDFADAEQLAIVGDTGAGKSSILDAITYALYRRTTFSKQPNQELMNASAMHMRVVLRFRVANQTWEVTRALKRTKSGTDAVTPVLHRFDDNGTKVSVAGTAAVGERIRQLIGLDGDAFLRTVILPQGNFARLLVADSPKERAAVLRQVWRTDELEAAGEVAGAKALDAATLRTQLVSRVELYPDKPKEHLKTLRKDRTAASKEVRAAKENVDAADKASQAIRDAVQEEKLCTDVLDDLQAVEVSPLVAKLDEIRQTAEETRENEDRLKEKVATVQQRLSEIASDDDGPPMEKVVIAIAKLDQIEKDVQTLGRAASEASALDKEGAATADEARNAQQAQAECRRDAKTHSGGAARMRIAHGHAKAQLAEVESRYAACRARQSDVAAALATRNNLQTAVQAQLKQSAKLRELVKEKQRVKDQVDAELSKAIRADSAATAAHGLHAGDGCPVCTQTLPRHWRAPANSDIDHAKANKRAAANALESAAAEAAAADGKLKADREALGKAKLDVDAKTEEFGTALQTLRELLPNLADELPAEEAVLAPCNNKLEQAEAALQKHEQEQARLDKALGDARVRAARADAEAQSLVKQVEAARKAYGNAANALRRNLDQLPKQFRPSIAVPDDWVGWHCIDVANLDAKRKAAQRRRDALDERQKQRKAFENDKANLEIDLAQLVARRNDEVNRPLEGLLNRANEYAATIAVAVGKLGVERKVPAAQATADIDVIRSFLTEVHAGSNALRQTANKRLDSALKSRQGAHTELAKVAEHLNVPTDDAEAVAEAATSAYNGAELRKLDAEAKFNDFSAIIDHILQLRTVLAEAKAKERALNDLNAALKDGAFLTWLTLRRSRSLLSHASVVLKQISGNRYAFADPEDADADAKWQWQVLDNDTGQARSPASLSGGEQFVASLALALGMVEMMARSGGKLESLFLDEGFGSLDRNNLDAAVEALAMVARHGRMVGVISHVRAVAEQFDSVLAVTRADRGSEIAWLTDKQRQDMAEDAFAGLLE